MSIRVAIASQDGQFVNEHFGRAGKFWIYQGDSAGFEWVETRPVTPPCSGGSHAEDALLDAARNLSDCQVVLCSAIGPGAQAVLESVGVQAFAITDRIEAALARLLRFRKLSDSTK